MLIGILIVIGVMIAIFALALAITAFNLGDVEIGVLLLIIFLISFIFILCCLDMKRVFEKEHEMSLVERVEALEKANRKDNGI